MSPKAVSKGRFTRGGAFPVTLGVALLLTTGCMWPAGTPVQYTYQLNAELPNPAGHNQALPRDAVLLVERPQPNPGFGTARMTYLERPHELQYFAVNEWADSPARMLHPLLVETLQTSGIWRAVVQTPSAVPADYRLVTEQVLLQHEFTQKPSQVRMAWRMQLIAIPAQHVMGIRQFETVHDAPSEDPYGGVVAANRAAATLLQEVVRWLDTHMNSSITGTREEPARTP